MSRDEIGSQLCTLYLRCAPLVGCHRVTQSGDPSPDMRIPDPIVGSGRHCCLSTQRGASMQEGHRALGRPRTPSRYHTRLSKRYTTHHGSHRGLYRQTQHPGYGRCACCCSGRDPCGQVSSETRTHFPQNQCAIKAIANDITYKQRANQCRTASH